MHCIFANFDCVRSVQLMSDHYCCVVHTGPSSKRKKGDDRKRKHHNQEGAVPSDKQKKRPKLEQEDGESLSEKDKNTLDRWKKIQQTTQPFIHPVTLHHHEQIIRQQGEEIERQQQTVSQQQKIIQEQQDQIRVLKDYQQLLIRECQSAGLKIPQIVSTKDPGTTVHLIPAPPPPPPPSHGGATMMQHPTQVVAQLRSSQGPSLPPPVSPAQVLSPPLMPQPPPIYSSISPSLTVTASLPSHPHPPPPHQHPPPHPPPMHTVSVNSKTFAAARPPPQMSSSQFIHSHGGGGPPVPVLHQSGGGGGNPLDMAGHLHMTSRPPYVVNEVGGRTTSSPMMSNFTFSPLTSSEFKDIQAAANDRHSLPVYSPNPVASYQPPFPDDFDSILSITGLPTGSGAGYGVGVMDDELLTGPPQLDLR